jgi:hypothetical protein
MATTKQTNTAKRNITKAQQAARSKRTIANMPKATRTALGKQAAAVAQRKRTGASAPKTRAELYEMAKRRDLPGRSKMGRDELARARAAVAVLHAKGFKPGGTFPSPGSGLGDQPWRSWTAWVQPRASRFVIEPGRPSRCR